MRFTTLLASAMFLTGIGCLAAAIGWGHDSAWSAAAMCFCTAGVCFSRRQKPPEEG